MHLLACIGTAAQAGLQLLVPRASRRSREMCAMMLGTGWNIPTVVVMILTLRALALAQQTLPQARLLLRACPRLFLSAHVPPWRLHCCGLLLASLIEVTIHDPFPTCSL